MTDIKKFKSMKRRELLKLAPVLAVGGFAFSGFRTPLLQSGLAFSDWFSAKIFREGHSARIFADSELTPFDKFPLNSYYVHDPGINIEKWALSVTGNVGKPGHYDLEQIKSLKKRTQNVQHICVEGWDVIGSFGGVRLSDFLSMVDADPGARFVSFQCADYYYESLDIATAMHPQSLLCFEMYDSPLTREHGAPLRLNVPTKIGYKQAKYLMSLHVSRVLEKAGYWEDQGYSKFYGL